MALVVTGSLLVLGVGVLLSQHGRLFGKKKKKKKKKSGLDTLARVICVSYSPNGTRIATGSNDRMIRIWDVETGTVVGKPLTGHSGEVKSVAYSPDGHHIISGSDDYTIRIWDAESSTAFGNPLKGCWKSRRAY